VRASASLARGNRARSTSEDLELRGDRIDLARAALAYFRIRRSARIPLQITTEVPMQSGMAGSTALVVAVVGALNGGTASAFTLGDRGDRAEDRVRPAGRVVRSADQHMAAFGASTSCTLAAKSAWSSARTSRSRSWKPLAPYILDVPLVAVTPACRTTPGACIGARASGGLR